MLVFSAKLQVIKRKTRKYQNSFGKTAITISPLKTLLLIHIHVLTHKVGSIGSPEGDRGWRQVVSKI